MGGQDTKWRRNIPENFNRLSKAHERALYVSISVTELCFGTVAWASGTTSASAGVVIYLEQGANGLHMIQLMPLPPHH